MVLMGVVAAIDLGFGPCALLEQFDSGHDPYPYLPHWLECRPHEVRPVMYIRYVPDLAWSHRAAVDSSVPYYPAAEWPLRGKGLGSRSEGGTPFVPEPLRRAPMAILLFLLYPPSGWVRPKLDLLLLSRSGAQRYDRRREYGAHT